MSEAILSKFIYNGYPQSVDEFEEIYRKNEPLISEKVRIMDRVPLFFGDHYNKLADLLKQMGYELKISQSEMKKHITEMIKLNEVYNNNLKIEISSLNEYVHKVCYYFIESKYPIENMYNEGVNVVLCNETKDDIRNASKENILEQVNNLIVESGSYEAILVDDRGKIIEGLDSNIFLIKDNRVYTPLLNESQPDTTRQRIIKLCRNNDIEIIVHDLDIRDLPNYEALFLTGTSQGLLPIKMVNDLIFNPYSELLRKIMKLYNDEIERYLYLENKIKLYRI